MNTGMTGFERIINRHIVRLLTDLEDAACPAIYRTAVKAELRWLRGDVVEYANMTDKERAEHDRKYTEP